MDRRYMTKIILFGLLLASISGCTSISGALNSGFKSVDCTAVYSSHLGAGAELRTATVAIKQIRIDKNGTYWIRPVNNLQVRFFTGWKSIGQLTDYQCKGEDYGLRSTAIRREW